MAGLLERSSRYIDRGQLDGPLETLSLELEELRDDIALIDGFSHVVVLRTEEGLVLFDTTAPWSVRKAVASLRRWSEAPVHTMVYTHGHVDHVGGAFRFVEEAADRGHQAPQVLAHEAVPRRFARYDATAGYNGWINLRQFRGSGLARVADDAGPVFFDRWVAPTETFQTSTRRSVGGVDIELHHARGETDDHAWGWLPHHRAVVTGDFVMWTFPNAGNPQKVQRYPQEWAQALRAMQARQPELLLPAHGLPIEGRERIATVLGDVAEALEGLVADTLALMNDGRRLDEIVHEVHVPADLLARPWLRPVYDDPEFTVRNIWRLYGGWYDGNPAHLKPARDADLAAELAALAGGVDVLVRRALELTEAGDDTSLRLAGHLVEAAVLADPHDRAAQGARAAVNRERRDHELALTAKAIFGFAADESDAAAGNA